SRASRLLRQMRWTRPAEEPPDVSHAETPENTVRAKEWQESHVAAVRALTTPNIRLAYLAVHLPHELEFRDFEEAARFRRGGAAGLARPPEVAGQLWRRAGEAVCPRVYDRGWELKVVGSI